jgi:hypothetical protein
MELPVRKPELYVLELPVRRLRVTGATCEEAGSVLELHVRKPEVYSRYL